MAGYTEASYGLSGAVTIERAGSRAAWGTLR